MRISILGMGVLILGMDPNLESVATLAPMSKVMAYMCVWGERGREGSKG